MYRVLPISIGLLTGTLLLGPAIIVHNLYGAGVPTSDAPQATAADQKEARHKTERDFLRQRVFGDKRITPNSYDKAKEEWKRLPRAVLPAGASPQQSAAESVVTSLRGVVWKPIGPSPITFIAEGGGVGELNGRVNAIAISPNNPDIIYLGSGGGGVWRSNNAGFTWTPLLDQEAALGIGQPSTIAIDPNDTNTIYVGTSMFAVLNLSKGILKSTDGGGSWVVLGAGFPAGNTGNALTLFEGKDISNIIVDPANSDRLYLAASNGLFFSTDGGRNWSPGINGGGVAQSLVLDTPLLGPSILYAGINGSGIRRSDDGGQNWRQILSATTPAVAAVLTPSTNPTFTGPRFLGKIVIALAPPTFPLLPSQVMYSSIEITTGAPCNCDDPTIFASTDQGGTWTLQASGLNPRTAASFPGFCQCGFTMEMGVDPASPGDGVNDIIYWGGTNHVKSIDSGVTFTNISNGQHADTHSEWVFVPRPFPLSFFFPSIVYTGNDGGIWRSTDGGAHWTGTGLPGAPPTINAGGLQIAQFYNLDFKISFLAGDVTLGALQDNGIDQKVVFPFVSTGDEWTNTAGGDGWDVAFDGGGQPPPFSFLPTNKAFHSTNSDTAGTLVFRSDDLGSTWFDITPWRGTTSDQGFYRASVRADPNNSGFWYVSGSQNLWQSRDSGDNWRIIASLGGPGPIDVAAANANNVVFAVGNQVFVSTNALAATVGPPLGVIFVNVTRNLPGRAVTRVAFDPNDPTVIYATLSGFDNQTLGQPGHVFRTTIRGSAWTNISPALDVPFNAVALDGTPTPTTIYIGTDLGVVRSVDAGKSWTVLDDIHLPNVPVTDLALGSGVLRASTFGRGAFEFAVPDGPIVSVNAQNGLQFGSICQGTKASLSIQVFNVGTEKLLINSVQPIFGSNDFSVLPGPSTPLIVTSGGEVDFGVQFTPTSLGTQETATIRISSDDPAAPSFSLIASGAGVLCP
jgi:photosystem II stability/assembly factor-like uncharacterized protein